jgi:hypothetical protein
MPVVVSEDGSHALTTKGTKDSKGTKKILRKGKSSFSLFWFVPFVSFVPFVVRMPARELSIPLAPSQ